MTTNEYNPVREGYHYVYVLLSIKSGKWYTGFTNNLRKRFDEHQNNLSRYTKNKGPFRLIYFEACLNKYDAIAREKYLKTGMGKRYIKNRIKRFLSLTGYNEGSAVRFGP